MPAEVYTPTPNLRFIERDLGHQRTGRILQQQWVLAGTYLHEVLDGNNSEWRDVPLATAVSTELPIDTSDIPEAGEDWFRKAHRELPAGAIEEITLSEAATKAWNEPGKARFIGADWATPDPEERVARFDVSLANQLQRSMERNAELAGLLQASVGANEAMLEKIQQLESQLPDGMKHCTILFEECPKGHGSLRGANWVKPECQACRIQKQQDALRWFKENGACAHPSTIVRVAEEGMNP